uniref:FYVE-type domain-containing protein n=1 Tax=Hyaloperonospora arabidopsidis (strain Emoy2) TaxID=559515 RepID=M4B639_HYAAE
MARRGRASSRAQTTTPSASTSSLESSPLVSYAAPSTSSSSRIWTPLRDNYFQPPPLSARERAYLVRKSCEAAQELVERARSAGGPITWRHVEKHNDVQVYAGSLRSVATAGAAGAAASMCAVTSVPGTVHEVASLFELGSTRHMKEFARAHREWFYDGVVLHVMAPRTKEKPLHQVTAKWMVAQMPPGLPHRDFCFLECQDKFVDARGRKGWVLGQHSIKLPGCDDLKREFGLVRGSLYHSGFVVVESEERPGHVDVIHLVQLNLKEHTPVPLSLLRARVLFVTQVRNMLRSKRLNEQRYRSDLELVPKKYRSKCGVCKDSFSLLLLRKMNCRKCGEVVCAACSKEFSIENSNFAATNGGDEVRKLRICMHCFQAITTAPKPTSALVQPAHSSTMSISFLGVDDAGQHATSRVGGRYNDREDEPPKIFLQSMHREKPSRQRMSSTLHMSGFRSDLPHSASRHRTRGEPDMGLYARSQHQHEQQRDYGRSHNHRESQRLRPSDFRPSQSLSLDDPITRGEDRYTMDVPGLTAAPSFSSIFDHPSTDASQSPLYGLTSSSSSDLLVELSSNDTGNFSRLQELSSRERLERLQREDNMARSGNDHRMPDAYMSALQQASRDKHELDMPTPVYQAPSDDFCAYRGTFDDKPVLPPDFGPYESTLDDFHGPPLLDVNALNTTESSIPIDLASMCSPTRSPTTPQRGERDFLRPRERKSERYRESTSSDSSAISIDIDTYEDVPHVATIPSIPEQQQQRGEQYRRDFARKMMSNVVAGPMLHPSRENGIEATHDSDEDSDTSMGASDDEEEGQTIVDFTPVPPRWSGDDNVEETKVQDFSGTLAFPPPSPSSHGATTKTLERPSAVNSSAHWRLEDHTSADTRTTGGVENVSQTNTEAVNGTPITNECQLQRSNVEDLNDHDVHQVHVLSKRSEMQIAGEDERIDGLCNQASEGVLVSRELRLSSSQNALVLNMVGGDANADVRQLNKVIDGRLHPPHPMP